MAEAADVVLFGEPLILLGAAVLAVPIFKRLEPHPGESRRAIRSCHSDLSQTTRKQTSKCKSIHSAPVPSDENDVREIYRSTFIALEKIFVKHSKARSLTSYASD